MLQCGKQTGVEQGGCRDIISMLSQSPEKKQENLGDTVITVVRSSDSTNLMLKYRFGVHYPPERTRTIDSRAGEIQHKPRTPSK